MKRFRITLVALVLLAAAGCDTNRILADDPNPPPPPCDPTLGSGC